jgi:membrane-bound lytic murein transglycosylase F
MLALLAIVALASCKPAEAPRKPWREELTIIVPQDANRAGVEFELQLVSLFASHMKIKVRQLPLPPGEIMDALLKNKAHLAAAGLRSNSTGKLRFGPSYQAVNEHVVCVGITPKRIEDLIPRKIAIAAGSAQESALQEAQQKVPALHWEATHKKNAALLLDEVAAGTLECTVANEEQVAMARNYNPGLHPAFNLSGMSRLAWAFAPDSEEELIAEVQKFFALIKQDGTLSRLLDRYYGHNERLEPVDSVTFVTKTRTDLPHFQRLFEEAGALTGIEWQLLAALAYQESHWNPLATSPTNVRGMMMLTEETADRMKVDNRLDPRQSILAGARYLQLLKEQLPPRIPETERIWMALAAYNQGMGHLEDARVLAARRGLKANTWGDVKKTLPLLMQPEYFKDAKHGQARGGEAVILVETVHLYYDMLKHLAPREAQYQPATPFQLKLPGTSGFSPP